MKHPIKIYLILFAILIPLVISSQAQTSTHYYKQGIEFLKKAKEGINTNINLKDAESQFKTALQVLPDSIHKAAWLGLAETCLIQGHNNNQLKLDESIKCSKQALELDNICYSAYKIMGLAYFYEKKENEAIEAFTSVLKKDENDLISNIFLYEIYNNNESMTVEKESTKIRLKEIFKSFTIKWHRSYNTTGYAFIKKEINSILLEFKPYKAVSSTITYWINSAIDSLISSIEENLIINDLKNEDIRNFLKYIINKRGAASNIVNFIINCDSAIENGNANQAWTIYQSIKKHRTNYFNKTRNNLKDTLNSLLDQKIRDLTDTLINSNSFLNMSDNKKSSLRALIKRRGMEARIVDELINCVKLIKQNKKNEAGDIYKLIKKMDSKIYFDQILIIIDKIVNKDACNKLLSKALELAKEKKFDEAIEEFRKQIKIERNKGCLYNNSFSIKGAKLKHYLKLGRFYMKIGNFLTTELEIELEKYMQKSLEAKFLLALSLSRKNPIYSAEIQDIFNKIVDDDFKYLFFEELWKMDHHKEGQIYKYIYIAYNVEFSNFRFWMIFSWMLSIVLFLILIVLCYNYRKIKDNEFCG